MARTLRFTVEQVRACRTGAALAAPHRDCTLRGRSFTPCGVVSACEMLAVWQGATERLTEQLHCCCRL